MVLLNLSLSLENQTVSNASGNSVGMAGSTDDNTTSDLFGQLMQAAQGEGGKALPPAAVAERLGISLEQLQQLLAQLGQEVAQQAGVQAASDNGELPATMAADAPPAEDAEAFLLWLANQQQSLAPTSGKPETAEVTQHNDLAASDSAAVASQSGPAVVTAAVSQRLPEVIPFAAARSRPDVAVAKSDVAAPLPEPGLPVGAQPGQVLSMVQGSGQATPVSVSDSALPASNVRHVSNQSGQGQPQSQNWALSPAVALADTSGREDGHSRSPVLAAAAAVANPSDAVGASSSAAKPAVAGQVAVDLDAGISLISPQDARSRADNMVAPAVPPLAATANTQTASSVVSSNTLPSVPPQAPLVAVESTASLDGGDTAVAGVAENPRTPVVIKGQDERWALEAVGQQSKAQEEASAEQQDGDPHAAEQALLLATGRNAERSSADGLRGQQWQPLWQQLSSAAGADIGVSAAADNAAAGVGASGPASLAATDNRLLASAPQRQPELQPSPLLRHFAADPAAALGNQVQLLVARNLDQITVRLDPQELGSMTIQLRLSEQQLNVQFQVTNPHTREMVEQALPRLREMLGESGIQLGNTQVGQQQRGDTQQLAGDGQQQPGSGARGEQWQAGEDEPAVDGQRQRLQRQLNVAAGRLDFYV